MIVIVDLPSTNYRPVPSVPHPPSLTWLILALALGALGINLAAALITAGLAVSAAYSLALLPCCVGLGLALAIAYLEVTPCHANAWSGV